MSNFKLKTPKGVEETVVGAYQKVEDTVVGAYKKIEAGAVGSYQKIEQKFTETFLEPVEAAEQKQEGEEQ